VAVGDVNGDGRPDLVTANYGANTASVLLGAGGSFTGDAFTIIPPKVSSIMHVDSANITGGSAAWAVTFSSDVTGVDAADFTALTTGTARTGSISVNAQSGSVYIVTVNGLRGVGDVKLQLLDDGSITDGTDGRQLGGGPGIANGSFLGDAVHLVQPSPKVSSITTATTANSVSWTLTLSEAVTGLDATDFTLFKGTGVRANAAVTVTAVSPSVYTVTATGVSGTGGLALQLVDDGTIKDANGNRLLGPLPPAFAAQAALTTGTHPISEALGDVNGDGKLDLVIANQASNNLSVLLGNGDGTFATQSLVATGQAPVFVSLGDVNGDGKPDLVIANYDDDNVGVLLGNGDGTFAAQTAFATENGPISVEVADVNGDGKPDLVVANNPSDDVSVLLGNGDGTFAARTSFATGQGPVSTAVADVNGDGKPDLVVANIGSDNVSILLGNGTGGFTAQSVVATGLEPHSVAVADLNGDGKLDLVTANRASDNLSVFLGNGTGGFTAKPAVATGEDPYSVTVTDVDGDGRPDLLVANFTSGNVGVLRGDGSGGFTTQSTLPVGAKPVVVAVGDLNGDGRPDLVTTNYSVSTASVLLGTNADTAIIALDAKHPFTFFDHNHDKVTVKLSGRATGTLILNGGVIDGADIANIRITGDSAKSTLTITVKKDLTTGDGLVDVGEFLVDGALASFSGKAVDFTGSGLHAGGVVKSITAHDLRRGEIVTAGAATDKLALTLGRVFDGTMIQAGGTVTLKALQIGDADVQAAAFTSISVTAGELAADVSSFGAMGKIMVKDGSLSGDLSAKNFGTVSITGGDFSGSLDSLATAATLLKTPALKSLTVSGGSLTGDVDALGAIGTVAVKSGGLSGHLTAANFGAVSVTGGDFSGTLTSLTPAATLARVLALKSLTVSNGDLTGDVRLLGATGAIAVKGTATGAGGNVTGASLVASAIASFSVAKNFASSIVLAGADLGADHALGGGNDTFAPGSIGKVKITGSVSGSSVIGAGLSSTNATFKDGDDTILGGPASVIKSFTIGGAAAADSYFAAGLFKAAPKIAGVNVTLPDPRFKTP
jgi:hypothetical protein